MNSNLIISIRKYENTLGSGNDFIFSNVKTNQDFINFMDLIKDYKKIFIYGLSEFSLNIDWDNISEEERNSKLSIVNLFVYSHIPYFVPEEAERIKKFFKYFGILSENTMIIEIKEIFENVINFFNIYSSNEVIAYFKNFLVLEKEMNEDYIKYITKNKIENSDIIYIK